MLEFIKRDRRETDGTDEFELIYIARQAVQFSQ